MAKMKWDDVHNYDYDAVYVTYREKNSDYWILNMSFSMRNKSRRCKNEEKLMNEGTMSVCLLTQNPFKLMLSISTNFYNQIYAGQEVG